MRKGSISVETENIFPIIKQFLYSDQEIFLRELIANATDATSKLLTLARRGEVNWYAYPSKNWRDCQYFNYFG